MKAIKIDNQTILQFYYYYETFSQILQTVFKAHLLKIYLDGYAYGVQCYNKIVSLGK